jgi:hypothetical protein
MMMSTIEQKENNIATIGFDLQKRKSYSSDTSEYGVEGERPQSPRAPEPVSEKISREKVRNITR